MASSDLDLLDPDEYFSDYDRRAQKRRERRSQKKHSKTPRVRVGKPHSESLTSTPAGRVLVGAVALLASVTVVGLLLLWPSGAAPHTVHGFGHTTQATVTRSFIASCGGPSAIRCRELDITVNGRHSTVLLGPVSTTPAITPGTPIRVSPVPLPHGQAAPPGYQPWQFVNIDRHGPLLWLALTLLLLALIVIRLRGLLAALGVGLSLLLLAKFLVPAILDGEPAIPVALVCALAVMFITLILTSGIGPQTLAAALGIGSTLLSVTGCASTPRQSTK